MDFTKLTYHEFMDWYDNEHRYCPVCGAESYWTTLVGYSLIRGREEEYMDLNRCECNNCGDSHTYHDRVREKIK